MSRDNGNGAAASSHTKTTQVVATTPTSAEELGREPRDVQVRPRAGRRTFTAEYKRKIVREAAACGDIGGLLRREGLYSSHLTTWRREVELRELSALAPKKRGPRPKLTEADKELAALRRENGQLKARAERAELLVEIQKKVSALLGIPLAPPDDEAHS